MKEKAFSIVFEGLSFAEKIKALTISFLKQLMLAAWFCLIRFVC